MLEKLIDKYIGRRLFVFITATMLLITDFIDPKTWLIVVLIYIIPPKLLSIKIREITSKQIIGKANMLKSEK